MSDSVHTPEDSRRQALDLNNEAAGHLSQGKAKDALPLLRQALGLLPDDPSILLNLGGAYILLRRHAEAVHVLNRAAEVAPDQPMVWCNLGAALLKLPAQRTQDDQRRAIYALCRGLALDPKAPHVAYNLGLIHRDLGEWERAAHYFRLALEADPTDLHALRLLAGMEKELAGSDIGGAPDDGGGRS